MLGCIAWCLSGHKGIKRNCEFVGRGEASDLYLVLGIVLGENV